MNRFMQFAALILAFAAGTGAVLIVTAGPAMAGNIQVMSIEVHPTMPCVGRRC